MSKKIGVLVNNLGASQPAYEIINSVNRFVENNLTCCIIFQMEYVPSCIRVNSTCMNSSELWSYNGCIIANSFESAQLMQKAPFNGPKIWYIWDTFWLRRGYEIYDNNIAILADQSILLACRSNSHSLMIENYTNRRPLITKFDIGVLMNYGYEYGHYNKSIPNWISKIPGI